MLKVLLKKQMNEMLSGLFTDRRTGKRRSGGAIAGFAILLSFSAISMTVAFGALYYLLASTLAGTGNVSGQALTPETRAGLYFAFTGIITLMLGIIGGMFTTYSILYMPRDNELLLSMPVKPSVILASRMLSVYIMIVVYTVVSYVPAAAVYFFIFGSRAAVLPMSFVMYLAMTALVLALSCILGWLLALIGAKLGGRKVVTVVSILVSGFAYYFFYFGRSRIMELITDDPAKAERIFKTTPLIIFYSYGAGSGGEWLYFLIFAGIAGAVMAAAMLLLSHSFIALVTAKKGRKKKRYVEKAAGVNSARGALFRREVRRFVTDPLYLINNGFGSIMFIVIAVLVFINAGNLRKLTELFGNSASGQQAAVSSAFIPVALVSVAAMILSLTPISASSVSLEGGRLWIMQTIPVAGSGILLVKLAVHVLFSGVPAVIFTVCAGIVLRLGVATIPAAFAVLAFSALTGSFGLMMETHNPKLNWVDENVAVKQNLNVLFVTLAGFGTVTVFGALIPVCMFLPAALIPALVFEAAAFAGLSVVFFRAAVKLWETI